MKIPSRAWLGGCGVLALFAMLAWQLPRLLGVEGTSATILRAGLLLLGAAAAALLLLYIRSRTPDNSHQVSGGDDVDAAIAAAESRLSSASMSSESRIGRLPLAVVLGPIGSTKSSIITNSGLDAELLSGEVMRGDTVVPTDPVNVWYAEGMILVEAGGRLLDDEERWARFVRHLQPSRLAAAIGRGKQASRVAIVCIGCDEFLKPGASQQLAMSAKQIRARLGEISRQLGIRLPVYVLFTRADRLQFFSDFVRSFSDQEAQQVLGATLPLAADTGGAWAERESRRLNDAFGRVVHALSLRRLDVLPREVHDEVRANAYEFPRELRKIVDPAVQLLLDMFRPSQLGLNPLLRGFYFTGVRPVILRDSALDVSAVAARGSAPVDGGATAVFSAAMLRQFAQQAPASGGGRKVPQWVFLRRLFHEVILRDETAFRITGGGARVDFLRRGLIATAAVACLVLALGLTVSWANNRSLIRGARAAVEQARSVGTMPGVTVDEELTRLDMLREQAEPLARWQHTGRPLNHAWGLYSGAALHPLLHGLYFDRFERTLWRDTRERMLQYLRGLPESPNETSDFGRAQDALAAHLLTTSDFQRSTTEALAPTLLGFWGASEASDSTRARAERQFVYFAAELHYGNPYKIARDDDLVRRTQNFLRQFGPQAYYRVLVAAASSSAEPRQYSGPATYVRNDYVVPGAFTLDGNRQVQARMDSVDALFARYEWIYGAPPDKPERAELQRLYESDYVMHWQNYLDRASVANFSSAAEAAAALRVLAQINSPLVNMLVVASRETRMDSATRIGRAFQPLLATVPPDSPQGPTVNLQDYLNQLSALESRLSLLGSAPAPGGAGGEGVRMAADAAAEVEARVRGIASSYVMTGDASGTARSLQRLLGQPGTLALGLVTRLPATALEGAARTFCEGYSGLRGKFPFDPNGREDASARVVTEIFRKRDGALWSFYSGSLEPFFNSQGVPKVPGGERVHQTFATFFGRAADFSNALFTETGGPLISFDFRPVRYPTGATEVVLEVGGAPYIFSPSNNSSQRINWRPDPGRPVRLIIKRGAEQLHRVEGGGEWAIFRIFSGSTWREANEWQRVEWSIPGRQESFTADVGLDVKPVIQPGYLRALASCPTRVLN
jgi:type VI secretion system protein ImpL